MAVWWEQSEGRGGTVGHWEWDREKPLLSTSLSEDFDFPHPCLPCLGGVRMEGERQTQEGEEEEEGR